MSQLARLISILTLLRSKRILTATELSSKYRVSVRTIYRDIKKLEEAGVPIITLEGKGYSLMDGYCVAPIQFTEEQANSLITAEQFVSKTNDVSLVKNFKEAMIKIKSVLRPSVQAKSEILQKNTYVFETKYECFSSNILSEIQLAITNKKYMEISYVKVISGEKSFRKIEPFALYATNKKWILIAWCHLRIGYRAFRIDKIERFKTLEGKFESRDFDLQKYFNNCFYKEN